MKTSLSKALVVVVRVARIDLEREEERRREEEKRRKRGEEEKRGRGKEGREQVSRRSARRWCFGGKFGLGRGDWQWR